MSVDPELRLKEIMEMQNIPLCWAIVRVCHVRGGMRAHTKKEDLQVFHSSALAKAEYKRLLNEPNNGLSRKNLKLTPRRLRFGEGMYT